jgi:apolipoprotein N-acyltransferase
LHWLLNIPVVGFPILGWVLLSAFLALYEGTWMWLIADLTYITFAKEHRDKCSWLGRLKWTLFGAAAWVAVEIIQARLLSGFPWNLVGASQYNLIPLIQIASITGIYGVSFVVVWFSLSLFAAVNVLFDKPASRYAWLAEIILPLFIVLGLFLFGMARLRTARDDARPTIRVTFVQPSIPQTMIWNEADDDLRFQQLINLTTQALTNETDLLLWPEAAVPKRIRYHPELLEPIAEITRSNRVWMIVGSDDAEPAPHPRKADDVDYFNSSFLISPDGQLAGRYCKRNLVMFGEYVPLVRWLPFLTWFVPGSADSVGFSPGERVTPFALERQARSEGEPAKRVRTATLICFEDVFPQLVPEYVGDQTDFLINLTNDGWFGEGSEQWQHAAAATFRAVENDIPLLRCCNNGLTCWIDSRGRIRQTFRDTKGTIHGAGVMTSQIPVLSPGETRDRTFYNKYGDWFGWTCVGVAALSVLAKRLNTAKTSSKSP